MLVVVAGTAVVGTGVVVSDPPPQADAVNRTTTSTGTSLTISVCHLLSENSEVRYEPQVWSREDGLFGDTNDVAVSGEEQFNFDSLHRGGVSYVEQCVDGF
jgi:hypothetical protein